MKSKTTSRKPRVLWTIATGLFAVLIIAVMVLVNMLLSDPQISRMGDNFLGRPGYVNNSGVDTDGLDLEYYKSDYSPDEIVDAKEQMRRDIVQGGTVLLKNEDNVLPLSEGTKVSFFSGNSVPKETSRIESLLVGPPVPPLIESFTEAGFEVNQPLWDYYAKAECRLGPGSIGYGADEDFSINECPLSDLLADEAVKESLQDTVPVYVFSRVAGEGRDMPRSMFNHATSEEDKVKSYLEPDSTELEILQYLNDNFENVVLLVSSNAAIELDWVADFPNIRSVLFSPGAQPEVAGVFSGEVSPSGRTVDTFAADALASPAAQNFGDYQYVDENGELTKYNYVAYQEGIYVGYKYYETRYEDAVLQQGNAGDFDYASEVVYPFGYGISYTDFEWKDYSVSWNGKEATATITTTNVGDTAGRDVFQVYAQSPYTEYDKQNFVEKASVELVGFAKSEVLEPGQSATLEVTFDEEQLKSFDSVGAKTFILEEGDYYIAAGTDSHAAVNNILAAKGKTVADGMTAEGDQSLVSTYRPDVVGVDATIYSNDSTTGAEITNLFDDARGDYQYLTRADWVGTFPTPAGDPSDVISTWGNEINGEDAEGNPASFTRVTEISDEDLAQLDSFDSLSPIDPASITDEPVFDQDNDIQLIAMRGVPFDDPKWEPFLDQLRPEEYQDIITWSGYGSVPIESVNKPFTVDADTASGLIYGGAAGPMYPAVVLLAQTWDKELAYDYGRLIGSEAILGGANGWYAPAMNIHRTPFSGRNGEYYSEDGFLSGALGSASTLGASEKGLYTFIKHFAANDQENHRGDGDGQWGLATWANEQSLREIYLLPFEESIKAGEVEVRYYSRGDDGTFVEETTTVPASQGVMTAFNRLGYTWTGGHYPLVTSLLRDEWGFNGFTITDNANTGLFMDGYQMIESGADAKLTSVPSAARYEFDQDNPAEYKYGRDAMHRILYTIANSNAMNGAVEGSVFVEPLKATQKIQLGVNIGGGVLLALLVGVTVYRYWPRKKEALVETESVESND